MGEIGECELMARFTTDSEYTRVECPHEGCDYQLRESEWSFQLVTDHMCPEGHFFRIEGTKIEELLFYEIDPKVSEGKYRV